MYYLQVAKEGEAINWPIPEEELKIGSQSIDDGLIQYWAYPKNDQKSTDELPAAEGLAQKYQIKQPTIIVDQHGNILELILVKNGHAYLKTDSSLDNLEDNITALLENAKERFNISSTKFITEDMVSEEVEKKLEDLSESEENQTKEPEEKIRSVNTSYPSSGIYTNSPSGGSKKLPVYLIALVIIGVIVAGFFFRDSLLGLGGAALNSSPTPQPVFTQAPTTTPTPTPTPSIERSKYKVRVLNGTSKAGAAATLAEGLKSLGWQIQTTGNATDSAYLKTEIRVREGLNEVLNALIFDIKDDYKASASGNLKEADKADAEIIIGKE